MDRDPLYTYQSRGLLYSVVGHGFIVACLLLGNILGGPDFGPETVYSVTVEGGTQLGGMSQLEDKKNKEKPAPPKPESSKSKPEQIVDTKKEEVKKEESKPEEKAEVSLKEEKKKELLEEKKKIEEKKAEATPKPVENKPKKEEKSKADQDKEYMKAMQRYLGESSDAGGKGFGAARLGGNGMGGGEIRPPEFFIYRDLIKKTIKRNWSWFDTSTSLRANVTFYISREGEISDAKISKSSGNSLFDDSVLRAILKSSPLSPPPENVYQWFEYIRMEFDPQE